MIMPGYILVVSVVFEVTVKAISLGVIFAKFRGEEKNAHASERLIGNFWLNSR